MPVEFLTDDEAVAFGRSAGVPARVDLERVFFLDDEDMALIELRRGEHMKLGFALQLVTVRWIGTFLEDPLDVPVVVLDFVAEQLGIADPSSVKKYTERAKTKLDHQWEIRRVYGFKDFTPVEAELQARQSQHGEHVGGQVSGGLAGMGGAAPKLSLREGYGLVDHQVITSIHRDRLIAQPLWHGQAAQQRQHRPLGVGYLGVLLDMAHPDGSGRQRVLRYGPARRLPDGP